MNYLVKLSRRGAAHIIEKGGNKRGMIVSRNRGGVLGITEEGVIVAGDNPDIDIDAIRNDMMTINETGGRMDEPVPWFEVIETADALEENGLSFLLSIDGVGEKAAQDMLEKGFGSRKDILDATIDDLSKCFGIGPEKAKAIQEQLRR